MPSSQNGISPYSQTITPRGFQQIDISGGAVTGLTAPTGLNNVSIICFIQATGGAARFRFDGTDPTTAIGNILTENNCMLIVPEPSSFADLRFIRNSTDATILVVQYFTYATVQEA